MEAPQIITLLTDFGTTDAYIGIVNGILITRAPTRKRIDAAGETPRA